MQSKQSKENLLELRSILVNLPDAVFHQFNLASSTLSVGMVAVPNAFALYTQARKIALKFLIIGKYTIESKEDANTLML